MQTLDDQSADQPTPEDFDRALDAAETAARTADLRLQRALYIQSLGASREKLLKLGGRWAELGKLLPDTPEPAP